MTVADTLRPVFEGLFARTGVPAQFRFWDGSALGPPSEIGLIEVRSPNALRRIMYSPDELGLSRAYVTGEMDIVGPVAPVLRSIQNALPIALKEGVLTTPRLVAAVRAVGAWGRPLPPPPEEIVPRGVRHSSTRDKQAVSHHYDVGNDFYRLVLGASMTYSCARFADPEMSLDEAQQAKHDNVCRKLGLAQLHEPRLLDVGCGWGSMAIRAAAAHGARVVGITISEEQARLARQRVAEAGVADRVEIRVQDYREIKDGPYDAVSSIGMSEHVGQRNMDRYFAVLRPLVAPGGRMLNHAISKPGGEPMAKRGIMNRYVFPDGELLDVGQTVMSMQRSGFEVRDVEGLREHYATTLSHWVANLQARWDEAVALVGERRARVWLLYMSGSINSFDSATIGIHQVLGAVPDTGGRSGMAPSRKGWD
jgi:cyclopropane-fatty-acyl-phospholipid synthase